MHPYVIRYDTSDLYSKRRRLEILSESYGSDLLYKDKSEGTCNNCGKLSRECVGHVGYFKLANVHCNPLFSDEIGSLKVCICPQCEVVQRTIPKESSARRHKMHKQLLLYFQTLHPNASSSYCICKKVSDIEPWKKEAIASYISVQIRESPDMFRVIELDPPTKLLCRYVPVIPLKVISYMTHASEIAKKYSHLCNKSTRSEYESESKALSDLFEALWASIGGKEGICRQFMVVVNSPSSCRGVIVADPFLPINSIGISRGLQRQLVQEIDVTNANFEHIIALAMSDRLYRIKYSRQGYKLVSNTPYITCTGVDMSMQVLTYGTVVVLGDGSKLEVSKDNVVQLYFSLISQKVCKIVSDEKETQINTRTCCIMFKCVKDSTDTRFTWVPLMPGCKVSCVLDNTNIMVHRNPVMSADSMRMFTGIMSKEDNGMCLSFAQRYESKMRARTIRQEIRQASHNKRVRLLTEEEFIDMPVSTIPSMPTTGTRAICTKVDKKIEYDKDKPYVSNDRVKYVPPLITTGFGGDFDGDEMSSRTTTANGQAVSIVSDINRTKENRSIFYANHDTAYGVWVYKECRGKFQAALQTDIDIVREQVEKWQSENYKEVSDTVTSAAADQHRVSSMREQKHAEANVDKKKVRLCVMHYYMQKLVQKYSQVFANELVFLFFFLTSRNSDLSAKTKLNLLVSDFFVSCYWMETTKRLYDTTTENGLACFYTHVMNSFNFFCDSYGMSVDYQGAGAKEMVMSDCRPSAGTYDSLYKEFGNVVFVMPGNSKYKTRVTSSIAAGIAEKEYEMIIYKTRADMANKAKTAAPAGDDMRHNCSYWTDIEKQGNEWKHNNITFMKVVSTENTEEALMLSLSSSATTFKRNLDMDFHPLKYRESKYIPEHVKSLLSPENHRGQLKLLLSEIEFLTRWYTPGDLVIYIGAAPGTHLICLITMFPEIRFHVYDTGAFSNAIVNNTKVTIFSEYFTVESCNKPQYVGDNIRSRILLISDIRSETAGRPTERNVFEDNNLTNDIVTTLNPKAALLKFRCPFPETEQEKLSRPLCTCVKGIFLPQAWTSQSSSESRLMATRPYSLTQINADDYDDAMFTHNIRRRCAVTDAQPLVPLREDLSRAGIKPGFDYALHSHILHEYAKKYDKDVEVCHKLVESTNSCSVLMY